MKKIKAIGFDMDHTIVPYNTEAFEELTHQKVCERLVDKRGYDQAVKKLEFNFNRTIQGLVIDKSNGNLLKLSRFGKVKIAYHGLNRLSFDEQQKQYSSRVLELNDPNIVSLDTSFSISEAVLYSQLIELKDQGKKLPSYVHILDELRETVDSVHRDGTLKGEVKNNIKKYIKQDPRITQVLERLKKYGKKVMVITNSDFAYCKMLLEYAIDPFLKEHKNWQELFDVVITLSRKPRFFTDNIPFLSIDPKTGSMSNPKGNVATGIYQGGCYSTLQNDLGLDGDEILYLGDHIYGDVVSIKKTCNWRTALVVEPLAKEVQGIRKTEKAQKQIDKLMFEKEKIELQINDFYAKEFELNQTIDKNEVSKLQERLNEINSEVSSTIETYQNEFNPYWGELMRAGQEESLFASQVDKYACIYMGSVGDLIDYSPRTYFRPKRRPLAHEFDSIYLN